MILRQATPPTYQGGLLSLTGTQPNAGNVEIGSTITPRLTPTWNPRHAGDVTEYRLSKAGVGVVHTSNTQEAFTDETFQLIAITSYSASVDHGIGPILNDSLGDPDETGRIQASTVNSSSVSYTPVRRGFFGMLADGAVTETSEWIRLLPQSVMNPANNTTMAANINNGRGAVWAYPANLRQPTSLVSQAIGNIPVSNLTRLTVSVVGANDYQAIDYQVYFFTAAQSFSDVYTLQI
jgi:hypothetical protein